MRAYQNRATVTSFLLLSTLILCCIVPKTRGAGTASSGVTVDPTAPPPPQYPVTYDVPDPADVRATLDHIRARLEAASNPRLIDKTTGAPIADLGTPNPNAIPDPGDG